MSSNCAYCEINPAGNSDHVFPKGLGGENIYMDCVCETCNKSFSKIERELLQKSPVGLMRSAEGIEGYLKNKTRPASLKHQTFHFDEKNKIVYEVEVYNGFKSYIRPQIIKVGDNICAAVPSQEGFEALKKAFKDWRNEHLIMVTKYPSEAGGNYEAVKFLSKEDKYVDEKIELSKAELGNKKVIYYSLMNDCNEIKEYFQPRMFFDDSGKPDKLIVRSRNLEEGIQFVIDLLNSRNQETENFSYSEKHEKSKIFVSTQFNAVMMQQALVKIGLNALMYYYPETKYNPSLKPAKDFIVKGTAIKAGIDKKIDLLDTRRDMHSVLFYQLEEGLMIRTSLFGSHFIYSFIIEGFRLFQGNGHFSGLEVDYKTAKQKHYPMGEYLLNRANDLGCYEL